MRTLRYGTPSWRAFLAALPRASRPQPAVAKAVASILRAVRRDGDEALVRLTARFDRVRLRPADLRVRPSELRALARRADRRLLRALREMAERVEAFHARQRDDGFVVRLPDGSRLEEVVSPLDSVALYVPGGAGAYPSSVLMNAIPARVAGVPRLQVVTPPRALETSPGLAAALTIAGLTESVFRVGGAQAVAACAYGTATVPAVAKIVGPGNAFVAEAKRQVRGTVEIDQDAGPSEVVILADGTADAGFVAADLLAQAEHGSGDETVVLVTPSDELAAEAARLVVLGVASVANAASARRALARFAAVVRVRELAEGVEAVNALAPEHVEILARGARRLATRVIASAVFVGPYAPVAVGDYGVGPNHVLPTGGAARHSSPLSVRDFQRRSSRVEMTRRGLARVTEGMVRVAMAEGFRGHAQSLLTRFEGLPVNPLRHVKPAVRQIAAYTLAARRAPVKVNQNENPYDLPEAVKKRVLDAALTRPWSRYPDFDPRELLERLAAFAGWRADGVLAGNGSNELIEALLLVTVGPGTRVLVPEPTFTLYALLTKVLGGELVPAPLGPELEYVPAELRAMREAVAPGVTIVCSPNNPTGSFLEPDDVASLCAVHDGLVVVDEAYHEFAGKSVVPLLADHPNLVVLRTFSKAMGMAGLRVGYLLASPELVREVNKARLPYNLNFFSQAAALGALEDAEHLRSQVDRIVRDRDELFRLLAHVPGVRPYPSRANFILFELTEADPKAAFESIYARGVLVRDVSATPRLSRCLRVSVGSEEENEAFLTALRHALEEQKFRRAAR